jgi:uncharacterized protein
LVGSVLAVFAAANIASLATRRLPSPSQYTEGRLLATLAIEAVLVLLWLPYLKRRGWSVDHVTLPLSSGDVVRALGLAVAAYLAYFLTYAVVALPDLSFAWDTGGEPVGAAPATGVVIAVSVLNPLFEEFLYLGYVVNALRPRGPGPSLMAALALRVTLHLGQGAFAFLSILPLGIIFSLYYLRTGRLWPVIGAHAMLDAFGLTMLAP